MDFEKTVELMKRNIIGRPKHLSEWAGIDVQHIAKIISSAVNNEKRLPFTADEFEQASSAAKQSMLLKKNCPALGFIKTPCVITDVNGTPMIYYLPGLMNQETQRSVFQATANIGPRLYESLRPLDNCGSWRVAESGFRAFKRPTVPPGCVNFSPGWLAQGRHHVASAKLKPSISLRGDGKCTQADSDAVQWLGEIDQMQHVSNLLLALLHPQLYAAGADTLQGLQNMKTTKEWALLWQSVFSCLCVISSRVSQEHRDSNGHAKFLDVLFNTGHSTGVRMLFRELGAEFDNRPGTALLFSGKLWLHEVPAWTSGERVVYAYFMRPEVLSRFGYSSIEWPIRLK